MTKRRVLAMLACGVLTAGLLTGCGGSSSDTAGADDAEITVVSREDGSGTRGAFVELFGVQDEDDQRRKDRYDNRGCDYYQQYRSSNDDGSRQ